MNNFIKVTYFITIVNIVILTFAKDFETTEINHPLNFAETNAQVWTIETTTISTQQDDHQVTTVTNDELDENLRISNNGQEIGHKRKRIGRKRKRRPQLQYDDDNNGSDTEDDIILHEKLSKYPERITKWKPEQQPQRNNRWSKTEIHEPFAALEKERQLSELREKKRLEQEMIVQQKSTFNRRQPTYSPYRQYNQKPHLIPPPTASESNFPSTNTNNSGDLKYLLKQSGELSLSEILQQRNLSLDDLLKDKTNAIRLLQNRTVAPSSSPAIRRIPLSAASPTTKFQQKSRQTIQRTIEPPVTVKQEKYNYRNNYQQVNTTKQPSEDQMQLPTLNRRIPNFAKLKSDRLNPNRNDQNKFPITTIIPLQHITISNHSLPDYLMPPPRIQSTIQSPRAPNVTDDDDYNVNNREPVKILPQRYYDKVRPSIKEIVSAIRPDLNNTNKRIKPVIIKRKKIIVATTAESTDTTTIFTATTEPTIPKSSPTIRVSTTMISSSPIVLLSNELVPTLEMITQPSPDITSTDIEENLITTTSSSVSVGPIDWKGADNDLKVNFVTNQTTEKSIKDNEINLLISNAQIITSTVQPVKVNIGNPSIIKENDDDNDDNSNAYQEEIPQSITSRIDHNLAEADIIESVNDKTQKNYTNKMSTIHNNLYEIFDTVDVTEMNPSLFIDVTSMKPADDRTDILELLGDRRNGARLVKVLEQRNMSLDELLEHRQRGSSQLHLSEIYNNKTDKNVSEKPNHTNDNKNKIENLDIVTAFENFPTFNLENLKSVKPDEIKTDSEGSSYFTSIINMEPDSIDDTLSPQNSHNLNIKNNNNNNKEIGRSLRDPMIIMNEPNQMIVKIPEWQSVMTFPISYSPSNENINAESPSSQSTGIAASKLTPSITNHFIINDIETGRSVTTDIGGKNHNIDGIVFDNEDRNNFDDIIQVEQIENEVARANDFQDLFHNLDATEENLFKLTPVVIESTQIPIGVRSAIIASSCIIGISLLIFLIIFITCRWRQRKKKILNYAEKFQAIRNSLPPISTTTTSGTTTMIRDRNSSKRSSVSGSGRGGGGSSGCSTQLMFSNTKNNKLNTMDPNSPEVHDYLFDTMRNPSYH